jgi:creatinine amidohydrolase/Fe(II)-dependent formamide hydrolase-like protein
MLALRPDIVDMSMAANSVPDAPFGSNIKAGYQVSFKGTPFFATFDDYSLGKVGNLGTTPHGANEEIGHKVLDTYVNFNVELLNELRSIDLDKLETKLEYVRDPLK